MLIFKPALQNEHRVLKLDSVQTVLIIFIIFINISELTNIANGLSVLKKKKDYC